MGSAGGSAGGSADNVYFHPDTSKFDVVNVYIHAGGGDQGHHTRMGGGYQSHSFWLMSFSGSVMADGVCTHTAEIAHHELSV